jgi:GTP-binding protein
LRYYKTCLLDDGENGSKSNCTGKDGDDIVIEVPLGTIARNEETGEVEAEILEDGQEIILMKGGGGWGNQHFATPTNQVPEHAQPGEDGTRRLDAIGVKSIGRRGFGGFS